MGIINIQRTIRIWRIYRPCKFRELPVDYSAMQKVENEVKTLVTLLTHIQCHFVWTHKFEAPPLYTQIRS